MPNPREKGKIAHSEWAAIQERHRKGESLASIARDYRCTAPAIRYIIKRHPPASGEAGPAATKVRAGENAVPAKRLGVENGRIAAVNRSSEPAKRSGITSEIQKRITSEISYFLVALDAAVTHGTDQNLMALHDATDRLMRAAARIRIEIERSVDLGEFAEAAQGRS